MVFSSLKTAPIQIEDNIFYDNITICTGFFSDLYAFFNIVVFK